MRLSWIKAGFLLTLLASTACSMAEIGLFDGSTAPERPAAALIHFEQEDTVTLAPGETREVHVVAEPRASYDVRFALIGDALDGWIESAAVKTDENGRATMELHAPNQPTTFHLRASIMLEDG